MAHHWRTNYTPSTLSNSGIISGSLVFGTNTPNGSNKNNSNNDNNIRIFDATFKGF